ncbi:MAG: 3-deoxy-manno-octulosonate cytidylyltransferase [Lentisphaeria bacterium]|nr:3-deoxy-manno-octulosonate cytidylyltransferase [Lentisphaeria bacterium]
MNTPKTVAVIPARYGSTRFPGKPLALIAGKPMIQWTYESTSKCADFSKVIVATDDQRIFDAVKAFGGDAVMTSPECRSGSDRIWEAIQGIDADLIVNVQGDEPLIPANVLHELVMQMTQSGADMGTVAVPFDVAGRDPQDPNAVKVVLDNRNLALYFSRAPIPFQRTGGTPVQPLLHWGLYAYRREFLAKFVSWPTGLLEACEKLEQLRALENGGKIYVLTTRERSADVDVPEDIARVEALLESLEK